MDFSSRPGYSGFGNKLEDYEVQNLIGKGGFANVYRGKCLRTNRTVAIKMINKDAIHNPVLAKRVEQEIKIQRILKHPSILELYEYFEDHDHVFLILEFCSLGELKYFFRARGKPFTEEEASAAFKQIVDGVKYLHSKKIIHRDISLANMLITEDMHIKIADFGLATQLTQSNEEQRIICGTPNYISPEVATRSSHGFEADVWGLGCLLYTLLVGHPPFDSSAVRSTLTRVVMSNLNFPSHLSTESCDLIELLLKKNPKDRIILEEILEHPFMRKCQGTLSQFTAVDSEIGTTSLQVNRSVMTETPTRDMPLIFDSRNDFTNGRSRSVGRRTGDCVGLQSPLESQLSNSLKVPPRKSHRKSASLTNIPKSAIHQSVEGTHHKYYDQIPWTEPRSSASTPINSELDRYPPKILRQSDPSIRKSVAFSDNVENNDRYSDSSKEKRILKWKGPNDLISNIGATVSKQRSSSLDRYHTKKLYYCRGDENNHVNLQSSRSGTTEKQNCGDCSSCSCKSSKSNAIMNYQRRRGAVDSVKHCHSNTCHSHGKPCNSTDINLFRSDQEQRTSPQLVRNSANQCRVEDRNSYADFECEPPVMEVKLTSTPINSSRLMPTRHWTTIAIFTILDDHDVCAEILRNVPGGGTIVSYVFRVSSDGMRIIIYKPCKGFTAGDEPPKIPEEGADHIYSYESLPVCYWKIYNYVAKFINLVSTRTSKITYYSDKARCLLMENVPVPAFEAWFFEGGLVSISSEYLRIIDHKGNSETLPAGNVQKSQLSPEMRQMLEHAELCHMHCSDLESSLNVVSAKSSLRGATCFPIIVGRRPLTGVGSVYPGDEFAQTKGIFTPQLSAFTVTDLSSLSPSSRNNDRQYQAPAAKETPVKTAIVPNLGVTSKMSCGAVTMQYYDGWVMVIPSVGDVKIIDNQGEEGIYELNEFITSLPEPARIRLSHIPKVLQALAQQ